jgi:hypothetical protein
MTVRKKGKGNEPAQGVETMAMERVMLDVMARLDGLAGSARFGSSPEVKKLQKELREIVAALREVLSRPSGGDGEGQGEEG